MYSKEQSSTAQQFDPSTTRATMRLSWQLTPLSLQQASSSHNLTRKAADNLIDLVLLPGLITKDATRRQSLICMAYSDHYTQ